MTTIAGVIKCARIHDDMKIKKHLHFSAGIQVKGDKRFIYTKSKPSFNPEWNRDFQLTVDEARNTIEVVLYGHEYGGPTCIIDQVSIPLQDIMQDGQDDCWITLQKKCGKICLGLSNDNQGLQKADHGKASLNSQDTRHHTHKKHCETGNTNHQQQVKNSSRPLEGSDDTRNTTQHSPMTTPTSRLIGLCGRFPEKAQTLLSNFLYTISSDQTKHNDTLAKLQEFQNKHRDLDVMHINLQNEHAKLQANYKNLFSQFERCKNEREKEKSDWEHQITIYKDEKRRLQQEKKTSEKMLTGNIQDLTSLLQEEKSATQGAENRLNIEVARISEMNEKMKIYEAEIINYKKRDRNLPSTNIEIGAYEHEGITPAMIEEHWRYMFSELLQTFTQSFKNIKQSNPQDDVMASRAYRTLVHYITKQDIVRPRFQAYAVIREVSCILSNTSRTVIINQDGAIAGENREDFLQNLVTNTQIQVHSRPETAKFLLDKLVNPNDLAHKATYSFFDKLSDRLKEYLDKFFNINLQRLKEVVNRYSIGNDDVYNSLEIFLYTAIYIAIEISAISDNAIMGYWSSCYWDKELLNIQTNDFDQIPQTDKFYDEVERILLSESEKDQNTFLLFSVFPGCAYFDESGNVRVLSKCKVVSAGFD